MGESGRNERIEMNALRWLHLSFVLMIFAIPSCGFLMNETEATKSAEDRLQEYCRSEGLVRADFENTYSGFKNRRFEYAYEAVDRARARHSVEIYVTKFGGTVETRRLVERPD